MIASRKALIVVAAFVLMAIGLPWGGNVPAAFAQTISVTAADPPTGEQGTLNLNVIIKGKGFKNGAKAKWFKTGTTDPAGVNVKSTQFVSSTQLIATIDIDDAAALAKFDIQVANADGRTGKGTELFSVLAKKIDPCSMPYPDPSPSAYLSPVPGLSGYLDSTFGNGTGRVIGVRHMTVGYLNGRAIAIDRSDRIIIVGFVNDRCVATGGSELAVARFLADGTPDPSFGPNATGLVRMPFAGSAGARAVVAQPDNKLVVAGNAKPARSSDLLPVVIRLNEDGTPDGSFGSSGIAWVSPGGKYPGGIFTSVALLSGGRIVAAGGVSGGPYIARLTASGALDTTFNGSGKYHWTANYTYVNAMAIQWVGPDERVVLVGQSLDSLNHTIATVWRFTGAGALDSGFGASGVVRTPFHVEDGVFHEDNFKAIAIDSSSRIVAAGYSAVDPTSNDPSVGTLTSRVALARYDVSGNLDQSFGTGGRVWAVSEQDHSIGRGLLIQPDGKIVVAGSSMVSETNADYRAVVWRFNPEDGTADLFFGTSGWMLDPVMTGERAVYWTGVALQSDGRIVCAGYGSDPSFAYAILGRFWQ
jgi:uncharacterized delta-60 repeat protein